MEARRGTTRDRIAGSLYGLLAGDAFGWPMEGWSAARIAAVHGRLTEMVTHPRLTGGARELHSDDGQQALAVCDAVLERPDQPGPAFARRLVDLLEPAPTSSGCLH